MKTKIISVLCVIAFISLFISSIAGAESWVLWTKKEFMETTMKNNTFWGIINAYPDHNQCLQAKKRIWQVIRNQALEDKKSTAQFQK